MPTCPKCHTEVAPGSRFCPGCGSQMTYASQCPSCGVEIAPGAVFCTKCGTRVAASPQAAAQPAAQPLVPGVASTPTPVAAPGIALGSSIPAVPQQPIQQPAPASRPVVHAPEVIPVQGSQIAGLRKGLRVAVIFNIISLVLTIIGGSFIGISVLLLASGEIRRFDDFFGMFFLFSLFTIPAIIGLIKTGRIKRNLKAQIDAQATMHNA